MGIVNLFDRVTGKSGAVYKAVASSGGSGSRTFVDDPDMTTSLEILRKLRGLVSGPRPVSRAIQGLLVGDTCRDEDVEIRKVTAVTASKGGYIGNLPRLLTTIHPPVGQVASLPIIQQMAIVHREVMQESGCVADGRFELYEEAWSGRLIAANTGTARRIALLREHQPTLVLQARILPSSVSQKAFFVLTEEYRVILLPAAGADTLLERLDKLGVEDVELVARVWEPACAGSRTPDLWGMLSYRRDGRFVEAIDRGISESAAPVFDFSQWLRLLSAGRQTP